MCVCVCVEEGRCEKLCELERKGKKFIECESVCVCVIESGSEWETREM